jgi:ADP-ribosylglycohydrolase
MPLPDNYRTKIKGGWLGKNVGGTLGGPSEGDTAVQHYFFYDPIPTDPMPNDDFELQMAWLEMLDKRGLFLTPADFAQTWEINVRGYIAEYLQCILNVRRGFTSPVSGAYNNWFTHGMGAAIRSEIWAMIAPGQPVIAASFAYLDSSLDHAREGVDGAMFMAAVESAAFVDSNPHSLVRTGLSFIPQDGLVAAVIRRVIEEHRKGTPPQRLRHLLCADFAHATDFTYVPINLGFLVLGLLYGETFDEALCLAVNCGYDTDCTGASLGSILGIMHGPSGIPAKWLTPIGEGVVISSWVEVENCPRMLDDLTVRVAAYAEQVSQHADELRKHLAEWTGLDFSGVKSGKGVIVPNANRMRILHTAESFLDVDYLGLPDIGYDEVKDIRLIAINRSSEVLRAELKVAAPAGWTIGQKTSQAQTYTETLELAPRSEQTISISLLARASSAQLESVNEFVVTFTARGTPNETRYTLAGKRVWLLSTPIDSDDAATQRRIESDGRLTAANCEMRVRQVGEDDITQFVPEPGRVVYVQLDLQAEAPSLERLVANNTGPIRVWLNGNLVIDKKHRCVGIMPAFHLQTINPGCIDGMGFADIQVPAGRSVLLLRLEGCTYSQEVNVSMVGVKPGIKVAQVIADFTPFTACDHFICGREAYLSVKHVDRPSLVTT